MRRKGDALSIEHIHGVSPFTNGGDRVAYVFNSQNLISLSRSGLENFARLQNRTEPWFVVFDAPWRLFGRSMVSKRHFQSRKFSFGALSLHNFPCLQACKIFLGEEGY
ncbi:hypothetical protein NC653_007293 [Populus alba x Populus x berolinensis]|uniref:Uncharacterized protein n=1 Tax=Populus alba x Populus x berolinensis TaxID=444605 RepID=A0AAD6RGI8_9ROSI|nr:hypothetical protein NC653_007293 [Populus alba x Populus x berolinensis]